MQNIFLTILIFIIGLQSHAQRIATTQAGQTIAFLSDGSWQYLPETQVDTIAPSYELPYQSYMTSEMVDQYRSILKEAEYKEILAFVTIDSLSKEIDHKKMKISQSKRLKNKLEQKQHEVELKDIEKQIKTAQSNYKSATANIIEIRKIRSLDLDEYNKKIKKHGLTPALRASSDSSLTIEQELMSTHSESNKPNKKPNNIPFDCNISKDYTEGKNRQIEMAKTPFFAYTPEKLKSYFKDKELMTAEVAVVVENGITKLRLTQKLISKDASKNYGHIPYESLMRITLISGKKVDIYSLDTSYGDVENYTGHVIYKTDFLLKPNDVKSLSDVPVDTIGLMWTSGFETYTIYDVDVVMKQLVCVKKVLN